MTTTQNTAALAAHLIAKHGAHTALCDIADREFDFGGDFDALARAAGHDQTAKHVVNEMRAWSWTAEKFAAEMSAQTEAE